METKGDVGCDRMVFAINSDIFVIVFNSKFSKWSLDQVQNTINLSMPYSFTYFSLGIIMEPFSTFRFPVEILSSAGLRTSAEGHP